MQNLTKLSRYYVNNNKNKGENMKNKLKKYFGYLLIVALTYNVALRPLLTSFGINLPAMAVDEDLLRTLAGVLSLLGG